MSHDSYNDGQPSFQKSFKSDSIDLFSYTYNLLTQFGSLGLKKKGLSVAHQ